ncbi:MBL fold metallo-hydrolase [Paenibacillus massiliensis]|uniref:MBL fold metallo-hydrolase n=1 Tax=Paenibacillus massiliensis TaxID=225917 RepID=UPI000380D547|nr:MBL fold metallo-hydrolase [Paenibacillus massiliensis]
MKHQFEQLTPHIIIMHAEHETDRPILAAITGSRRTLLLDAGNSLEHANAFKAELERRGIREPDILVLTHWHWDHSFGMHAWDIPAIAHTRTSEMLTRLADLTWSESTLETLIADGTINDESASHIRLEYDDPAQVRVIAPDIHFSERLKLELGDVTCELVHVGGDHSEDSCFLHVLEDNVLFLGDALAPAIYGGPRRYRSTEFLRLLGLAYAYDASWYVESHGRPMSNSDFRADLAPWEQLAHTVDLIGGDRDKLLQELTASLRLQELPPDLIESVDYFIAGLNEQN